MQPSPNGRLWVRLMKRHRVERDATVPCFRDDPDSALRELLPKMDLSQPVWLPRHRADWNEYALTRFTPDHFMEPVSFDFMEISYIFPEDEKKQGRRRNPLEDV
ncbi:MAG: hypothetical protein MRZ54_00505 [Clostridiales bacterium]|nr:hypothetical protein [Clostridiales bacterium]